MVCKFQADVVGFFVIWFDPSPVLVNLDVTEVVGIMIGWLCRLQIDGILGASGTQPTADAICTSVTLSAGNTGAILDSLWIHQGHLISFHPTKVVEGVTHFGPFPDVDS